MVEEEGSSFIAQNEQRFPSQGAPEVHNALIKAMADKVYTEDNVDELLKRAYDINAYLMNFNEAFTDCRSFQGITRLLGS